MKPYTLSLKPKAAIVERLNRTLKERLQRYFTETRKKRWVDVLENFTNLYNNTFHSTIGMPPAAVTLENSEKVRLKLYANRPSPKCDLASGDKVRIALDKGIFEKGYKQNWSDRIYIVIRQRSHFDVCVYEGVKNSFIKILSYILVKPERGEPLDRPFYRAELNLISKA